MLLQSLKKLDPHFVLATSILTQRRLGALNALLAQLCQVPIVSIAPLPPFIN